MAKKQLKTVLMSGLAATLEASLEAPSATTKEVTVNVTMAPVETTPTPKPVKRKLTAEEQVRHEKQWQELHLILVEAVAALVKEGKPLLKEEQEKAQRKADLKAFADDSYGRAQEAFSLACKEIANKKLEDAQREAAVRAKKARQNANRDEHAQANRDRDKNGSSGKGGNGNDKKGGKGK